MIPLRLGAIDPDRLRIINPYNKLDGSRSSTEGLEAGIEPASERMAWIGEAALRDGVVLREEAEGEGVANCGCDDGGIEGELGACTD